MPVDNKNPNPSGYKPYKKKRRKRGEIYVGEPGYRGPGRRGKREDYSDILKSIYGMTTEQVQEWAKSPERNQFELVVAAWLKKARSGDMRGIENVLDRLIGKVTQVVEQRIKEESPDLSQLTDEELAEWDKLCEKTYGDNT